MKILRIVVVAVVLVAAGVAAYVLASAQPVIAGIESPPPRSAFPEAEIARGAKLAALGNCHLCHTADGGADYAGNRPVPTPFGAVYSTNITPAPGNGIGRWPEAAFARAMRQGVARRGRHLFPAFPYDHFTRLSDADIKALYAFMMTRHPVDTAQQANDLAFPFDQRWAMRFWNALFFSRGRYEPDSRHDAEWNRGAYLVEGVGHCGDCHTARNFLGGESGHELGGGEAEGWTAPALDAASPAPVPWDAEHLFDYLSQGWDSQHGAAAGPMQGVAESLAQVDPADLHAIAVYLAAEQGKPSAERRERAAAALKRAAAPMPPKPAAGEELGAALFAGACAECHVGGQAMLPPHGINLALSSAVAERDPRNAIHIVLRGIRPPAGQAGPWMPHFADAFTDAQLAALLNYVRAHYGGAAPWKDLPDRIRDIRRETGPS